MIPGLGRSPGEGKGYPLQFSGLENSMDCMYSPWGHQELDSTEQLSLTEIAKEQWDKGGGINYETGIDMCILLYIK